MLTPEQAKSILSHFNIIPLHIKPTGNGHINDTHLVSSETGKYILQRINTAVFPDVNVLMSNIMGVTSHIKKAFDDLSITNKKTLEFLYADNGTPSVFADGSYYRVCKFIDASSIDCAQNTAQIEEAGRAFGNFQKILSDYDASTLSEVIPRFHDTANRFTLFENAVATGDPQRVREVEAEIAYVRSKKETTSIVVNGLADGSIPLRVTHNDTKINNILFDADDHCIAVIDLDTVMPGSMLYDFGDAMRSGGTSADEDEVDLTKVYFKEENFEAYTRGYLSEFPDLTARELELLPFSAFLLTYECGMRFLTDYLQGDVYFKTAYPTHNLVRARNQFALAKDIESKFDKLAAIVKSCL